MKLTILGCYSATPRTFTNPTSQVLEANGHIFLIDCGEGTQVQLRRNKIKFSKIKHIFISHLHGDHCYGLVGLVSTFRLLNRQSPLHIYGPKGIKEIITLQLKLSDSWTNYDLYFHELSAKESVKIFEDEKITVHTIPLKHRIYSNGFFFMEKLGDRKLNIEAAEKANIHYSYYTKLKQGFDVKNEEGITIKNETVTFDPEPPKSYAFCSDTKYNESVIPIIKNATALYHESTFLEKDDALCERTGHSSSKQAATIAKLAQVKHLILGHYSTRYKDLSLFKTEAETIFQPVDLADDGLVFEI